MPHNVSSEKDVFQNFYEIDSVTASKPGRNKLLMYTDPPYIFTRINRA